MRVKICGLTRVVDAEIAEEAGASHAGAVLVSGSSRRLTAAAARPLSAAIGIPLVIVTAGLSPEENARAAEAAGARVVQLHGSESPEALVALRALGGWELWKAVRVRTATEVVEALERYSGSADLLLLDGWHPTRLGGGGRPFPWAEVAELRPQFPPSLGMGVAGGLSPENVGEAIRLFDPDLVDVSSGVESSPGVKDSARVRDFVRAALALRT